ncbi:MAG: hypothetical protein IT376_22805 [Polyangiaceae bacterium]|nr:hypothetical protein [Polyangiaceae bacterium]
MTRALGWAVGACVALSVSACGSAGEDDRRGATGGSGGLAGAGGGGGGGAGGAAGGGAGGAGGGASSGGGGGAGGGAAGAGGGACNGDPSYCDRPYDQVAVVCTHNAMSSVEDPGFDVPTPNQQYSFERQLDDGVRCMMLDTYLDQGAVNLCHAACFLGATPWVPMLQRLRAWMDAHPREVVTFILEANIDTAQTRQSLVDGGVWELVYHHDRPPGSAWPTLRSLIASGTRLVMLTDDDAGGDDWYLDWRRYGWETPYNDATFTCDPGRGDPTRYDHQLFILNHYTLCPAGGCASNGEVNNEFDFLWEHAARCWQADSQRNPWGHIPTFVNLDHYEVPIAGGGTQRADAFDVADALNAAWPEPP